MSTIAVRDLRNNTAAAIRRVEAGETVILTSRGRQVARIVPIDQRKRPFLSRQEYLAMPLADGGLLDDLAAMGDSPHDTVGPW
ncbi:MAG: type II toxin-antitoxin system prevent-host-death family antitoxin [Bifidobacteriaceae bacterium]|jgi:prevent-host-death family protein|nr:type II toxin-antitoxin system prevent-host-death family antitoxin [Bifidobacteriaceae bacterium]